MAKTSALVVPKRDIRKREVVLWLARELARGGAELGVTRRYMVNMVTELDLTMDELDIVVTLRQKHGASIPSVRQMMNHGIAIEDIQKAYETRASMLTLACSHSGTVSINHLIRVAQAFPSPDYDGDDMGFVLMEAHERLQECFPWIHYFDQTLRLLRDAAENLDIANLETAVDELVYQSRGLLIPG